MSKPILIVLAGPTGVGKTDFALRLAEKINGEVVMADSQTVLKKFQIGTAKPTLEEQKRVRHHCLDLIEWNEKFDVASYAREAEKSIQDILSRQKKVIISGGTGLYLKVLMHGLMDAPPRDEKVRQELRQKMEEEGIDYLYEKLSRIDPIRASQIKKNDTVRIIRALEIFQLTKTPPSELIQQHQFSAESPYSFLKVGLFRPRDELYQRINERVLKMLKEGWLEEVESLLNSGISLLEVSFQPIGYKKLAEYLSGKISFEEAIEQIQKETRQLAKRQMTWFRADKEMVWFHPDEEEKIENFLNQNSL